MGTNAMSWKVKKDVPQEEIENYKTLAVEFIEKTKGWAQQEYDIRYINILENAPLATFNVLRHDAREEMRKIDGFGSHPTGELQVYIHTKEMRAFADYEEFKRIMMEVEGGGQ